MKKFIFSYDDDNHYKMFWFDGEYVGSLEDIGDLLTTIYGYGLEDDPYNPYDIAIVECNIDVDLNEKDFDVLHNYLCKPRAINLLCVSSEIIQSPFPNLQFYFLYLYLVQ